MKVSFTEFGKPEHFGARIFLLQGSEAAVQHDIVKKLLAVQLPVGRDYNLTYVEAAATRGANIVGMAQTIPFLAERRGVMVRCVERMPREDQKALADAVEGGKIPATGFIVLLRSPSSGGGKPVDLATITKAVERHGLVIQCELTGRPKDIDARLVALAQQQASGLGKRMAPATAAKLVGRLEPHVGVVEGETRKLALYCGERVAITDADVIAVVPNVREEAVFRLTDAIANGSLEPALALAEQLYRQGEAVEMMVWNLSRHFRFLLQARWLFEQRQLSESGLRGLDEEELRRQLPEDQCLVDELRRNSWKARIFTQQARAFSTARVIRGLERLLQTDLQLKGAEGGVEDRRLALEMLCVDLCRVGTASER